MRPQPVRYAASSDESHIWEKSGARPHLIGRHVRTSMGLTQLEALDLCCALIVDERGTEPDQSGEGVRNGAAVDARVRLGGSPW